MSNFIFNVAQGQVVTFGSLPAANDALIVVPLEAAGLETDTVMRTYTDLASLLAGSTEQTTMGRKTMTTVTVTVDNTANTAKVDCDDFTWTAASGNAVGAILFCYDGDTTSGTDSNIIPVAKYDFAAVPAGSDIPVVIGAGGIISTAAPLS